MCGEYMGTTENKCDVLRDILQRCITTDADKTLCAVMECGIEGRADVDKVLADFDEIFAIAPQKIMCAAAMAGYRTVLEKQLEKNPDEYLRTICADAKEFQKFFSFDFREAETRSNELGATILMLDVLKEQNFGLYRSFMEQYHHERMLDYLSGRRLEEPERNMVREYLTGNRDISVLYPFAGQYYIHARTVYLLIDEYQNHCADKAFIRRCRVCMAICLADSVWAGDDAGEVTDVFYSFDMEKMDIAHQLKIFGSLLKQYPEYRNISDEALVRGAVACFDGYLRERREETLAAFSKGGAEGHFLGLRVMRENAGLNKQEILSYTADTSKRVKTELFDILSARTDWADDIKALLDSQKAVQKEMAARVISYWQQTQADTECNMELLQSVERHVDESLLEWAYQTPFCVVHRINGETAGEEYLKKILYCYASFSLCGISRDAQELAKELVPDEFAFYMNELFDKWVDTGAEPKKRWVIYASAIHGGEDIIERLKRQIKEWITESRGELAGEAVMAMSLNPSPRALLTVDDMSRKVKHKQVKKAAEKALDFAANQLGISRDALADRIVPSLGFDGSGQRTFDYGTRKFQVMLMPSLEIEVYDENGKKLKNLPKPAKSDDKGKAEQAYEEFKQMKKEMKTVASSQRQRMETALSTQREWCVDAWKQLFVDNPLMHPFAIGLIWGIYENGSLVQSFRYMEDGSFNTWNEEEYRLPDNAQIGMVHPIELSESQKAAWKQQLEDYEIVQPIEQLECRVYDINADENDKKSLMRFYGCVINERSLDTKMLSAGWTRGPAQDGGWFFTYYREETVLGIGSELRFSGRYIEMGSGNENVTLQEVRFYKLGTVVRAGNVYDEADEERALLLKDLPPRYFSDTVRRLAKKL